MHSNSKLVGPSIGKKRVVMDAKGMHCTAYVPKNQLIDRQIALSIEAGILLRIN